MKLKEFQAGKGVPLSEQILTVENQQFGTDFFHLDVSNPAKWRVPTRTLKKWVHGYRLFLRDRRLSLNGLGPGMPIYLCNSDGRVESVYKVQLAANRLKKKIQGHAIVLGKSDIELDDALLAPFQGSEVKIFGNNLNTKDPLAGYFPMGRDFRGQSCHDMAPQSKKDKLVYCNFSLDTHPVRKIALNLVKQKSYFCFEHMGEYRNYALSHQEFYLQLSSSKFCLAPRGNAIETFRMWDAMYLGTVPIVIREAKFHEELQDLPILFLDHYEQFAELDEVRLSEIYTEFLDRDWNYEKLRISYWRARVDAAALDLSRPGSDS